MLPEWRSIDRLLCCADVHTSGTFEPALQLLRDALPAAEITILVSGDFQLSQSSAMPITWVQDWFDRSLIEWLRQQGFDAAIIFTEPFRSPYAMAYLCYLVGIPIRVGQSQEFGGSVLSTCITPPLELVTPGAYHRHLLQALGLQASGPVNTELDVNETFALRFANVQI